MNIELKYKVNYRITVVIFSLITLLFGAISIAYRIKGVIIIPLIASFLAVLISIEKKRILSIAVSAILLAAELYIGTVTYYTAISLSSILLAVIISICYSKGIKKSDCAFYGTFAVALSIALIAGLYILGSFKGSAVTDIFDNFLVLFEDFKTEIIEYITSMAEQAGASGEIFSKEYISALLDVYLDCTVALISILSFFIVGIAHKFFSGAIRIFSSNPDKINKWSFVPAPAFAYFYFIIAILSMFTTDNKDVLGVSVMNLYLIFMFVFAYVGYKFVNTVVKKNGRSSFFVSFVILTLTLAFSSFAVQILAVIGAFVSANYAKFTDVFNFTSNNPFNE